MSELPVYYTSVNEDGVVYDHHTTVEDAIATLREFPNDIVVITLDEPYGGEYGLRESR